jgi:RHS repeat-associated protein
MKNGIGKYNKHYYTGNHLSSTQLVTDGAGVAIQQVEYAPFGEVVNEYNIDWNSGQVPDFKFNGKELDEENGMYYFEARYQSPPVFISRDVLFEEKPWMSPYSYCRNNPLNMVDPSGNNEDWVKRKVNGVEKIEYDNAVKSQKDVENKYGKDATYLGKTYTEKGSYYSLFGQKIDMKSNPTNAKLAQKIDDAFIKYAKYREEYNQWYNSASFADEPMQSKTDFSGLVNFVARAATTTENIHDGFKYANASNVRLYVNGANMLGCFETFTDGKDYKRHGGVGNLKSLELIGYHLFIKNTPRNNPGSKALDIIVLTFSTKEAIDWFKNEFYKLFPQAR